MDCPQINSLKQLYFCHWAVFSCTFVSTLLFSAVIFIFIEKPGMDTRRLYPNKYQKALDQKKLSLLLNNTEKNTEAGEDEK